MNSHYSLLIFWKTGSISIIITSAHELRHFCFIIHPSTLWVFVFPHNMAVYVTSVCKFCNVAQQYQWKAKIEIICFLTSSLTSQLTIAKLVKVERSFCDFKNAFIDVSECSGSVSHMFSQKMAFSSSDQKYVI